MRHTSVVTPAMMSPVKTTGMVRRLTTLDLGLALLPRELAADDVAAGRLRRVLPE